MNDVFSSGVIGFAEALGEALGRGVARGINAGLGGAAPTGNAVVAAPRRGRPPKNANVLAAAVPAEKRCRADGCASAARAKGLCSRHYQAERRKQTNPA